jgi:hypothetical protein
MVRAATSPSSARSLSLYLVRRLTHTVVPRSSAILLLIAASLVESSCSRHGLPAGSDRRAFDPAEWKAVHSSEARDGSPSIRQQMLRDIVTRILPGKTRGDIEEWLGPSLVTPYFRDTKRDLIYFLVPERGSYFRIDSEWLLIWLDAEGPFHHYQAAMD